MFPRDLDETWFSGKESRGAGSGWWGGWSTMTRFWGQKLFHWERRACWSVVLVKEETISPRPWPLFVWPFLARWREPSCNRACSPVAHSGLHNYTLNAKGNDEHDLELGLALSRFLRTPWRAMCSSTFVFDKVIRARLRYRLKTLSWYCMVSVAVSRSMTILKYTPPLTHTRELHQHAVQTPTLINRKQNLILIFMKK